MVGLSKASLLASIWMPWMTPGFVGVYFHHRSTEPPAGTETVTLLPEVKVELSVFAQFTQTAWLTVKPVGMVLATVWLPDVRPLNVYGFAAVGAAPSRVMVGLLNAWLFISILMPWIAPGIRSYRH